MSRLHHAADEGSLPVIFVCLVFHPDTSASSILFTDLFAGLAAHGTKVSVLCGFPSKDGAQQVTTVPRKETFRGIEIVRCGLRIEGKRNLFTRAVAYASFLVHAGWKLRRPRYASRVVGGTDPPFTSVALWAISRILRISYEVILLDIYPDGLVAVGALSDSSPLTRIWRVLNRWSYRTAARIIVIGRDMTELLHRRYRIDPSRVTYVPHWASTEVDQMEMNGHRPRLGEHGPPEKFVIQYSGNMGLWHDMDSLVRAADLLRDDSHIHFLFIGKGRRRAAAEQLAGELELDNITWLDFLPRDQLPASLMSCDAALISLRAGMEGVAVPSKFYGILASGRPVIAQVPRNSEVAYAVQEEGCGIVVEPGDTEGLAAAIRRLASSPTLSREMGARARHAYETRYTIAKAVRTYRALWEA